MSEWRKPAADEQARGFVAMLPMAFYCQTDRGMLAIDYTGGYTDKETKVTYPRKQAWQGYTQAQLERRAKRGDSLPTWWQSQDASEAWLDYIATGIVTAEIEAQLQELGSYKKAA
jgi:hypothetical protein